MKPSAFLTCAICVLVSPFLLVNQADADATVYVVHGIPGADLGADPALPVDVTVNGDCFLESFEFGDIVGPVALPAGSYDFAIGLADGADPCGADAVIEANGVVLEDGKNYSIVAHLDDAGGPTASVFDNNLRRRRRQAVVNAFHAAFAPEVDILFRRTQLPWWRRSISGVENGESGSRLLLQGSWDVSIAPAGTTDAVFGPLTLDLDRDTAYLAYAVGSLANGTFTVLLAVAEDAAPMEAEVFVVHGIPGEDLGLDPLLPVDISVNGNCVLQSFEFGQVAGPLSLPGGAYDIAIGLADTDNPCGSDPVIEADGVMLDGGKSYSIVAHLTEGLAPTAGVFLNEKTDANYFGKVNVFHTAAAPSVDIRFKRDYPWWWPTRRLESVSNGQNGALSLLFGNWDATIFPANDNQAVFGPAALSIDGGTTTLVFAVGSLENETFTLIVETLTD